MRFFSSHSQKMKNDRLICLEDKFTDIGPEVFSGFSAEYIILAETTKTLRDFAFSGIGNCKVYLPKNISEIEPNAFDNVSANAVFYCEENSYAAQVCKEHNLNMRHNIDELFKIVNDEKGKANEEKARQIAAEKAKKEIEAKVRREIEEKLRKEAEEKAKKAEKEAAEQERRRAEEEKARQAAADRAKKEAEEKMRREIEKKVRRELEEKIRRELEAKIRLEIEEKVRKEAEEKAHSGEKNPNSGSEKNPNSGSNEAKSDTITIYLYDEKSGEKKNVVLRKDFPSGALGYVTGNTVYLHKTYKGGKVVNTFVSQKEYDAIKASTQKQTNDRMISDNNSDTENKPKTKKCQFCGSTIDVDDKFCPFCGKYLQKVRRCPQCGESYEIDDKFCINCGKRLS